MTDKEIRKLSRSQLMELLAFLRKQVDELAEENSKLKAQLEGRDTIGNILKMAEENNRILTQQFSMKAEESSEGEESAEGEDEK